MDYLVRTQQADGSWYGRWGVAYIYGTCFALRGLRAVGEDDREVHVLRAGEWLRAIQNADGGWGESCASYDNDAFTPAKSTPSQTAWAILGLLAGGDTTSRSLHQGIEYLLETQRPDGSWNEVALHRHGLSESFLSHVSFLPAVLPVTRSSRVCQAHEFTRDGAIMRFPLSMTAGMAGYIFKNKMRPRPEWQKTAVAAPDASNPFRILPGRVLEGGSREPHPMIKKRFPIVLMLEPLHACNLTCTGCGRIREYESTITERIPLEECLAAVDECGAPMVSICGGEPMMYPQIGQLVAGILERGKHIYLCTNGMFIVKRLHEFTPDRRFFFNVHLDGLEKTHDMCVEKEGVFREAIEGIRAAKKAGFMVCTNTTIYKETDMKEIEALYEYLEPFDVDGHQLSPAYGYSAVNDREIFMTRDDIHEKFKDVDQHVQAVPAESNAHVSRVSEGRPRSALHRLGQSDVQHQGLEGPLLSHHRRALQDVRSR